MLRWYSIKHKLKPTHKFMKIEINTHTSTPKESKGLLAHDQRKNTQKHEVN